MQAKTAVGPGPSSGELRRRESPVLMMEANEVARACCRNQVAAGLLPPRVRCEEDGPGVPLPVFAPVRMSNPVRAKAKG
jgi:hypothetical protein